MTRHQPGRDATCALRSTQRVNGDAIAHVAVIGAGLMGHGIALELAAHGYAVNLHDADREQLARAPMAIAEGLTRMSDTGIVTPEAARSAPDRIATEPDLGAAVGNADLVI